MDVQHDAAVPLPPIYFATYGSGAFVKARNRIAEEARRMHLFADVMAFGEDDLDAEWMARQASFMKQHPRGSGYYIWKAQVVHQVLNRIPEGALLLYVDSGCVLNVEGAGRLRDYMRLCINHPSGILCFSLAPEHTEARWTKMDVLKAFQFTSEAQMATPQLVGGIFMMVNNAKNRHFVEVWKNVMETHSHSITDAPSVAPNHPSFVEHRHDQSVWSIIRKVSDCLIIPDETWWDGLWDQRKMYPIHARRKVD